MQAILNTNMNKRVAHTRRLNLLSNLGTGCTTPLGERNCSAHPAGNYVFSAKIIGTPTIDTLTNRSYVS